MVSLDTLLRQASDTAETYMGRAVHDIDDAFGKGYAAAHPDLVAAFMKVAAMDFNTAAMIKLKEDGDSA